MSEYVDLQPDVHDVQLLLLHVAPVDLLRQAPAPRDPAPATPRRRAASPRTRPRPPRPPRPPHRRWRRWRSARRVHRCAWSSWWRLICWSLGSAGNVLWDLVVLICGDLGPSWVFFSGTSSWESGLRGLPWWFLFKHPVVKSHIAWLTIGILEGPEYPESRLTWERTIAGRISFDSMNLFKQVLHYLNWDDWDDSFESLSHWLMSLARSRTVASMLILSSSGCSEFQWRCGRQEGCAAECPGCIWM